MNSKIYRGTYGYLDKNKRMEWVKAIIMIAIPLIIFFTGLGIHKTRLNLLTVVAILGCLPGCNQVVHAIMATRYHSMDTALYKETESLRGNCIAVYENVLTTYEKTYYIDVFIISGREAVGFTTKKEVDVLKAAAHVQKMIKDNSYQQNVKIYRPNEKKAFEERIRVLANREPEEIPFETDERYPNYSREEVIAHIIKAISF